MGDGSGEISKDEFDAILVDEEAVAVLESLNVDLKRFSETMSMFYEVYEVLTIQDLMELMLQYRGDRNVTMKDLIDAHCFSLWSMKGTLYSVQEQLSELLSFQRRSFTTLAR